MPHLAMLHIRVDVLSSSPGSANPAGFLLSCLGSHTYLCKHSLQSPDKRDLCSGTEWQAVPLGAVYAGGQRSVRQHRCR